MIMDKKNIVLRYMTLYGRIHLKMIK